MSQVPGHNEPGTCRLTLLLVGIQGVPHGGQIRTQGLCHSVDVFVQYGAHQNQHPVNMLTPITYQCKIFGDDIKMYNKSINHDITQIDNKMW